MIYLIVAAIIFIIADLVIRMIFKKASGGFFKANKQF
jgi:hypothetical protein